MSVVNLRYAELLTITHI